MKRRNFVKTLGASAVGATVAAASSSTATATFHHGTDVRTVASSLNVRDAPWGNIITSVDFGTTATNLEGPEIDDGRWYRLDFGSFTGWCEASYLVPWYAWWHDGAREAFNHTGTPYEWGGSYPWEGFDCSGLIWYSYREAGVVPDDFPRHSRDQAYWSGGTRIGSLADAQSGDLLFWDAANDPHTDTHHIVIHLGHQKVFHAPSSGRVVQTDHRSSIRGGRDPDVITRV